MSDSMIRWADAWSGFVAQSLLDGTVAFAIVFAVWLIAALDVYSWSPS